MERRNLEEHNQATQQLLAAIRKLTADRQEDRQQITKLITDREEDRQKMKEQANQIASLQTDLKEKSDQLNTFQATITVLQSKVESQAQRIQELENRDFKANEQQQQDETTGIEKLEKTLNEHSVEIKHLKTFAIRTSRLHETLSHPYDYVGDAVLSCLKLNGFETKEEWEKKWYGLVETVTGGTSDDCNYLEILNKAIILQSKFALFPKDWECKYGKLHNEIIDGDILPSFIKLPLHDKEYISIKRFENIDEFNKESSKVKWTRTNFFMAVAFKLHCCRFILFMPEKIKNIWLLHQSQEDRKVTIPQDGTEVKIEEDFYVEDEEDAYFIIKFSC